MQKLSALVLLVLLLAPMRARASTFDTYGFGSRGLALGGAQTADAQDFTATFYNPALLVNRQKINVGFGVFYEKPNLTVTPDDPSAQLKVANPPDFASYSLGLVYPFAGKVQNKVALGLGISLPVHHLIRVQGVEPTTTSWYLYESSPDRVQIFAGLSVKPVEWFSFGVGAQFLSDFGGDIEFNIDLFNKRFARRDLTSELITKGAPVAGLAFTPLPNLTVGLSYRSSLELDLDLPTNIVLGDLGTLFLDVRSTTFYTPHEVTLGVKFDPTEELTLTGDLEYARWSAAPNPAVRVKVRLNGDLVKGLGLDQALALDSQDAPPGFEDILIPRLGVEYRPSVRFAARGGYFFRPTPVPLQNGLSNILDGSTHAFSAGLGVKFDDPLEILADPVEVDVVAQHGLVTNRVAQKLPVSGQPTYSYGGTTELFAVDVRYNF